MKAGGGAAGQAGEGAEGVVLVVGGDGAGGGEVFGDVAVAIVGGEVVRLAGIAYPTVGEEASHAARALHGAG